MLDDETQEDLRSRKNIGTYRGGLYENIVYASEDEGEIPDKIRRGADAFLGFLKKYRELSREAGVRELTEKMINENGFSERI